MSTYIKVDRTPPKIRRFVAARINQAIQESQVMNVSRMSITCDINPTYWHMWLNGDKTPTVYELYKIALATEKPLEWFICGADTDEEVVITTTVKALKIEKSWSPDYDDDGTMRRKPRGVKESGNGGVN